MRDSRSRSGASPAGNVAAEPNGRWAGVCAGSGRGLFAIEVNDGDGFRAATTAEVDAALRQRELFGAAELPGAARQRGRW